MVSETNAALPRPIRAAVSQSVTRALIVSNYGGVFAVQKTRLMRRGHGQLVDETSELEEAKQLRVPEKLRGEREPSHNHTKVTQSSADRIKFEKLSLKTEASNGEASRVLRTVV